MAMIRQANAATMARDAIVLDLGDLKTQGEQIRARAQAEAQRILAQARAQREEILAGAAEQGRAAGLAQGLDEGRRQGAAEGRDQALADLSPRLQAIEQSLAAATSEFESLRHTLLAEARHDVLRLAVCMGEMVTKRVLDLRPEAVLDQVAAVLSLITRPTRLLLALHPDDLPLLKTALPGLAARFEAAAHVELVSDPALLRGSCIARGAGDTRLGAGEIDASIQTQLARIIESLLPAQTSPVVLPPPAADDQVPP